MTPAALTPATAILGASEGGGDTAVLLRSFVVALVVVSPVAWWQWRRVRAARRAGEADVPSGDGEGPAGPIDPGPPRLEDLVARIGDLAGRTAPGQEITFEVPAGATLDGAPADPAIASVLVTDALRRSGWEPVGASEGATWRCRRR